jgi:ABC-type multidrug transport system permease subunit
VAGLSQRPGPAGPDGAARVGSRARRRAHRHPSVCPFRLQVPFTVYYTPAIISYQVMLAGYSSLLIAVTTERERGMLKRLRGTPMPSWIFLAGEIMRTVVVVAVTVAVLVAVGAGVYHVPVQAHTVIGLAVYTVAGTACMCALGLPAPAHAPPPRPHRSPGHSSP